MRMDDRQRVSFPPPEPVAGLPTDGDGPARQRIGGQTNRFAAWLRENPLTLGDVRPSEEIDALVAENRAAGQALCGEERLIS